MITEPAPAKLNLALHIRRKRPDGYHDLETLFAFARDGDVVTVAAAAQDSFTITGPFAAQLTTPDQPPTTPPQAGVQDRPSRRGDSPLDDHGDWTPAFAGVDNEAKGDGPTGAADNHVTRARAAFRAAFACPPVAITLSKNLPVASGIGGGSADAAATLRALAMLTDVDPHHDRLYQIAAELGADVPACLLGRPALGWGKGDRLTPLPPFGDLPLLLINPRVALATAPMFAAWDGIDHGPIATEGATLDRARQGRNDFTTPAIVAAPVIAYVLALLDQASGATLTRMSGSGATCFALFADEAARDAAAGQAERRGWWTLATTLT